jgi:hypothetical protein
MYEGGYSGRKIRLRPESGDGDGYRRSAAAHSIEPGRVPKENALNRSQNRAFGISAGLYFQQVAVV